ncbi:hypothetical protein GCM10025778_31630 [Paeniglutamicibacter antarcticus]|uniref:Uncharacterized protein n=1 Tax=Paeniglutamicibacter antarcticus TaxID=494023 RepID=A0ABP9TU11_9MICC
MAHEYWHQVQNTAGTKSGSVRVELQGGCLAGIWAGHAAKAKHANGTTFMDPFSKIDVRSALFAASAVGTTGSSRPPPGR